jgi:cobalt-zinc-cadmium resistance protein CzcA
MNKIIEFSVNNRLFVFLITLIAIGVGYNSFTTLPIDAVPDITNTQVQINTTVPGLVPEEIERMITFPVEYSMNGIPGVENIRSVSKYGISQVTVVFEDDYDIYLARQLIGEKLLTIDLPLGLKPQMGPISTGLGEVFHYSLEFKTVENDPQKRLEQLMELRALQDWLIKPRLLTVKGINEVNTIGGFEKQFYIQPDIKKMTKYGIHFDDIENALKRSNKNVGGGYVQQTGEQILIRGIGLLKSKDEIGDVIVKRLPTFKVVKIKDIASVEFDKEIRNGAATVNGKESVIGTTFMLIGENSRSVALGVDKKLNDIRKDLPKEIEIKTLYDRSFMVNSTLSTVEHNLIMGALLVIIVLLLLVGNLRAAIITALTIPFSLLLTFILMKINGVSGNLMSLGALDFGIIIDGAVIVIENCVRSIRNARESMGRPLSRIEIKNVVVKATSEIRQAAGFGELIVIVTFVPLFALTGVEGKMFGPMAMTFVMALGSALLLSFTVIPALAATFLSGDPKHKTPYVLKLAESIFEPILRKALMFKRTVFAVGASSIALGIVLFSLMGSEFIPQLDEGDFSLQFIRPANISVENSVELQKASEKIIGEFNQIDKVFSKMGASEIATDPMGVNISDTYVMVKPRDQWPDIDKIKTKSDLIHQIKTKLELHIPAQVILVSQPVQLRFNELLEGTRADVSAKIYGDDMDKLMNLSKQMADIVRKIPGSGEAESESKGHAPMLQYTPKKEELAKLGVTEEPVLDAIQTALGGREMGFIYDGVKRFPIVTRLSSEERKDIDLLKTLPVGISDSFTVPIEQVANISFVETYSEISRENSQRRIALLINPETRDIEGFVNKAKAEVDNNLELPEGYYIEWGGSFKNLITAKRKLSYLVPLALLIILSMLFAAFKNIYQVLLIFTCAPMALVGGVIALSLNGMPFSISAGVGFIALSGISILNGVVLISYFNSLYKENIKPDDLAKEGVKVRLRPVLMTALTDIFGFLPMMFSTGLGAEVQKPLATVVVGGMISSTILTLIVLPSLYTLFIEKMKPVQVDDV